MNHQELTKLLTPTYGAGEARAVVRLVMEERFGLSQTDLLLGKDTTLSADKRKEFEKIAQRLVKGEPVQYVLGYTSFYGHRFRVTPDVLIPRPETEELVHIALDEQPIPANILDLCTGSGCIAISLAKALPRATVAGIDISEKALAVALENRAALDADGVRFFRRDILIWEPLHEQPFDLIVSNPPYVCQSEAKTMAPHVLNHEPHLALFVPDADPLLFYRAISRIGLQALRQGGGVAVEINEALPDETCQTFVDAGYTQVKVHHDQFGKPRFLTAKRP